MSSEYPPQEEPPAESHPHSKLRLPYQLLRSSSLTPIAPITLIVTNTYITVLRAILKMVKATLTTVLDLKTLYTEKREAWMRLNARTAFQLEIAEEDSVIQEYFASLKKKKVEYADDPETLQLEEQVLKKALQNNLERIRKAKESHIENLPQQHEYPLLEDGES